MIEWVISTSLLIVIVIVLRKLLKDRIQPWVRYALWLVVLARMLVPFQFGEFDFSMMNGVEQLPVVQEIDSMRNVDQIAHMDDGSVEGYDLSGLSADTPQIVARNKTDQEFERMETSLKLRKLFVAVWKAGMLLMAAVFLAGNGQFRAKLIRSRRLLSMENMACPVYVTESIETPCLFGFFKPAIYVTPEVAADSRTLRYAVEHEMSHYQQKDPLWSLLRGICLIMQW
ncbi:MAG: M56 family metallopeptidase, partial [Anaerovoracaceae bacterium]